MVQINEIMVQANVMKIQRNETKVQINKTLNFFYKRSPIKGQFMIGERNQMIGIGKIKKVMIDC